LIEITINKADAVAANLETLTSGMVNAIFLHFSFSEEWSALSKVAVFTNGTTTIDLLEAEWASPDTCAVPPEILSLPGKTVKVGLRGYSEDGDTVLPTTMCSLGSVKPGPVAANDSSSAQSLPVWEQLRTQMAKVEQKLTPCYTTLEKRINPDDAASHTLRISLHGVDYKVGSTAIYVYQCMRRRHRSTYWRHPSNWNEEPGEGVCKLGYGQLATHAYGNGEGIYDVNYPEVPEWMPNEGYLKTIMSLHVKHIRQGHYDLDLTTWLLPLLKPTNEEMDWQECGMIGIQGDGTVAPLLFKFCVVEDGKVVGESKNILAVGLRGGSLDTSPLNDNQTLKPGSLYTSIR